MDQSGQDTAVEVGGEVAPGVDDVSKDEQDRQQEEMAKRLDALGQALARGRSEAIAARLSSGIEQVWAEDEEFYQGIDDANRGEAGNASWRQKPPGQTDQTPKGAGTRSTVFPNITGPFVEAAAARFADMILPSDDRAWSLRPTPIPEAMDLAEGSVSADMQATAQAVNPADPQGELAIAVKAAEQVVDEAKKRADKAQKRIEDWHVECQWHAEVRKVIEDSARIGTGILKGPVPTRKSHVMWKDGAISVSSEIKPGSKWISPWNFYPDGACGEDVQNGSGTWEKDAITRKQLREMKGQEGYIESQIDKCLEEGPIRATAEFQASPDPVKDVDPMRDKFEIWYYHGTIEKEDLQAAGCDCGDTKDPHVPAMLTMVNNRVIRAALNPLDTGDFPYDVFVWRRRNDHWAGIGVARQIRTPQRIVTAATRNLMDNAGIAAGPMLIFRQGVVAADGNVALGLGPRRVFILGPDADEVTKASDAIGTVKVDMLVSELMQIITLGLNLAERVTGLPMILQGQQGQAPDTLGGMQMLNNNASAVLRRLARLFDDRITERQVRRYYTWLLQYGEDDEKGDYCIDARGSSALVERDLQNQQIIQMGSIVANPIFGLDPKKWAKENLLAQHFDPKRFEFDDQKWQQIVENMGKGPADPRLQVAQLRTEADQKIAAFKGNLDKELLEMEQRFDDYQRERDRQFEAIIHEAEIAGDKTISLDKLKGELAKVTITTRTQRDLATSGAPARVMGKPPTEPPGKARPGQSYQH